MGFVQFSREATISLGNQGRVGKELERVQTRGASGVARGEGGPVTRQARGTLAKSRQRETAAVGITVKVSEGVGVAEAWRIIMTSPSEGVAGNGTISSHRSDKPDK